MLWNWLWTHLEFRRTNGELRRRRAVWKCCHTMIKCFGCTPNLWNHITHFLARVGGNTILCCSCWALNPRASGKACTSFRKGKANYQVNFQFQFLCWKLGLLPSAAQAGTNFAHVGSSWWCTLTHSMYDNDCANRCLKKKKKKRIQRLLNRRAFYKFSWNHTEDSNEMNATKAIPVCQDGSHIRCSSYIYCNIRSYQPHWPL